MCELTMKSIELEYTSVLAILPDQIKSFPALRNYLNLSLGLSIIDISWGNGKYYKITYKNKDDGIILMMKFDNAQY